MLGNLNPTPPTLQRELFVTASLAVNSQASVVWDGNNGSATPLAEGLYGARVFSTQRSEQNNPDLDILVDRAAAGHFQPGGLTDSNHFRHPQPGRHLNRHGD